MEKCITEDFSKRENSKSNAMKLHINDKGKNAIYLLTWVLSLVIFLLCEWLISPDICQEIYSPLDDFVPFYECFVIFYVLWYFMIAGSIVWLLFYSKTGFQKLLLYMTLCQFFAIVIFIVYPNKQMLRPEVMPRDNSLSQIVELIHSVDTNTNVCPSLHVAISIAMLSVWSKEREVSLIFRIIIGILCILASLSTIFIKQHSVIDVGVALLMNIFIEILIYGPFWKKLVLKNDKT